MSATRRTALLALWDLYVANVNSATFDSRSRFSEALSIASVLRSHGLAVAEVAHGGSL